ncbi:T9SS type A sorting domain-containing protein [Flavobacterium subsaxonicum]|nr:T9SS type A sorting domain-containing protein [Flavobacterium subsaxonicum]
MKKTLFTLLLIAISYKGAAQTTAIPDPGFESALINLNIDSDGIVNGQVLTSDLETVTELDLDFWLGNTPAIYNLSGLEGFSNLQELTINQTELSSINISQCSQLQKLECSGNMLTSIDVSQNPLLEELRCGNYSDLGYSNEIVDIDLSNNPNIRILDASTMNTIDRINLKNGNNNSDMKLYVGFDFDEPTGPDIIYNTVCIQVDNEELAQNYQFPYSEWEVDNLGTTVNFSENCVLSNVDVEKHSAISVYPNPASDIVYINSQNAAVVNGAVLFDISGRVVREYKVVTAEGISVSGLQKGIYLLQITVGKNIQTKKIVIE